MPYTPDELWQQAINCPHASIIRSGDLELSVEFYGIYINKSGLGYEYKTCHTTGGDYYDKLSPTHIDMFSRLGYLDAAINIATEILQKKATRFEKHTSKASELLLKNINKKLCQLKELQQNQ